MVSGFFNCGLCGELISPTQKAQHMKEKHKGEEEHHYENKILENAIMPKKRGRNIIVAKTKTKMHEQCIEVAAPFSNLLKTKKLLNDTQKLLGFS